LFSPYIREVAICLLGSKLFESRLNNESPTPVT
jgi:hypothetical protein